MSGNKLLVDTNILLYLLTGNKEVKEALKNQYVIISFITELELLSFSDLNKNQEKTIHDLIKSCQLININRELKEITIELKRKYRLKLPDAIIAASAYYLNVPLFTADQDFSRLTEMDVILYEI